MNTEPAGANTEEWQAYCAATTVPRERRARVAKAILAGITPEEIVAMELSRPVDAADGPDSADRDARALSADYYNGLFTGNTMLLAALLREHPSIRDWIIDQQEQLNRFVIDSLGMPADLVGMTQLAAYRDCPADLRPTFRLR